MKGWRCFGD